jgi:stage V sporulation protein B
MVVTPFILSTAIYNLSSTVNNKIYMDIYPTVMKLDTVTITARYGIFSGKALTISNIPIAFASAMASAVIPSIAQLMAAGKVESACEKIGIAVKTTMLVSIPCAVGLFVLAEPVTKLLFPSTPSSSLKLAGQLLMTLSLSVVFYALSTLNSSILQGLGKVNAPIINAAVALVIQTVAACALLFGTELDLYSIAIANTLYSGIMCVLNQWRVRRAVGYRQEIKNTFVRPALAAVIMGLAAWLVYQGIYMLSGSMVTAVIPAVLIAVIVYFVMLIVVKGVTETELKSMPKGYLLVKAAKKVHLM